MKEIEKALQEISDTAHFLRMELMACGNTERADELCITIRKASMEALSALETEKPTEEAMDCALKVLSMEQGRNSTVDYANVIQHFAQAYHEQKCKECAQKAWEDVKERQNKIADLQNLTRPYEKRSGILTDVVDLPDAENQGACVDKKDGD